VPQPSQEGHRAEAIKPPCLQWRLNRRRQFIGSLIVLSYLQDENILRLAEELFKDRRKAKAWLEWYKLQLAAEFD